MDHAKVYDRLISRARGRVPDGYTEKHHVLPKCMGGTNAATNIVRLTPEEHFVAHQLLVRMHPEVPKLIFALRALNINISGMRQNNKIVGWMRRRMGQTISRMKTGVPRTPETIEKMRRSKLGVVPPPHVAASVSAALKGKPKTAEHNAKVSAANMGRAGTMTGRQHTEATKAQMSASAMGRTVSPETIVKLTNFAAAQTQEQRSARAHKAWATKRAKAAQQQLL